MKPDLLILYATALEAASFLDQCQCAVEDKLTTGGVIYSGKTAALTFHILVSGPGVFNTAHALTAYFENRSSETYPALIVQTGIAGVFEEAGLCIGEIAIADKEIYLHTGVASDGYRKSPLPFDLIENSSLSRAGIYPFNPDLVKKAEQVLAPLSGKETWTISSGTFLTVSTITASFEAAADIYRHYKPVMENMEGAAAAHICSLYNLPMIEIRAGSNRVGERDKTCWDINGAIINLNKVCRLLVEQDELL